LILALGLAACRVVILRNLGNLALLHALELAETPRRHTLASWSVRLLSLLPADVHDTSFHTRLGLAYWATGDFQSLKQQWELTAQLPDLARRYFYNQALRCKKAGQGQCELDFYQMAVKMDPSNAEAWLQLGILYKENQDWEQAIQALQAGLQGNSAPAIQAGLHNQLGAIYEVTGLQDLALFHYHEVIRLAPDDYWAQIALVRLYRQKKELKAALEHALIAVKLQPDGASGYLNLGLIYSGLGEMDLAHAKFCRLLQIVPEQPVALDFLARQSIPELKSCP